MHMAYEFVCAKFLYHHKLVVNYLRTLGSDRNSSLCFVSSPLLLCSKKLSCAC